LVGSAPAGGYTVQPGDSVWRIAQKFKVPQDELMKVNGIDNPRRLRVGMKLKIPRVH
jgi:LysM repeat protein